MIRWIQSEKWVPDIAFGAFFALVLSIVDFTQQGTPGFIVALLFSAGFFFFREYSYLASAFVAAGSLTQVFTAVQPTYAGFFTAFLLFVMAYIGPRRWSLVLLATNAVFGIVLAFHTAYNSAWGNFAGISAYSTDGRTQLFIFTAVTVVGINGFAWVFGSYLREFFSQRSVRLERDLVQNHNLVTMLEMAEQNQRFLIASDLNESVMERVSAMLTLTDGARYAARLNPEVAPRTLDRLAELIRVTHDDMRRLYDMLNRSVQVAAAPPNLNDVEVLAAQLRIDGYQTRVIHQGKRLQLSSSAELNLYRVIFDAVENIRKHSPSQTEIDVIFNWSYEGLQILVKDNGIEVANKQSNHLDGVAGGTEGASDGSGTDSSMADSVAEDIDALTNEISGPGITGMRERVSVFGGNLEAHKVPGVGFTVNVVIPSLQAHLATESI